MSALQEEFARERAQVDAVVASIEEEDRQEAAARRAQQAASREYVQSFVEEQHRLKQRRQQQLDAEDARQAQPACSHRCHTALLLCFAFHRRSMLLSIRSQRGRIQLQSVG